jgi:phosphatidylglycerophosphatase A
MKRLLTSCFGLGWLPVAPGTWGSLPPAIIFALTCQLGASALIVGIVMAAVILAGSVACVRLAPDAIAATGKNDPGEVVADEVAGQGVTFLVSPLLGTGPVSSGQMWLVALAGFLLFRAFDIAKPWPIRKLEKFPQGWGILADDLLAGAFAAVVLQIGVRLWLAGAGT